MLIFVENKKTFPYLHYKPATVRNQGNFHLLISSIFVLITKAQHMVLGIFMNLKSRPPPK